MISQTHLTKCGIEICDTNSLAMLFLEEFLQLPSPLSQVNQPQNIFKSFVNVYTDDTTIYGHTSKNQNDQSLTSDLTSDLALTVQCEKELVLTLNT